MSVIPTNLVKAVLTDSEVTYYIVPDDASEAIVAEIRLINKHTTTVNATVWAIPPGETSSDAGLLLYQSDCPPKIPQPYESVEVLAPRTAIAAIASVTGVITLRINGVEIYE